MKNPCAVGSCDTFLLLRKSPGLAKVLEELVDWLKSTAKRKLITGCCCFLFLVWKTSDSTMVTKVRRKGKGGREEGSHGREGGSEGGGLHLSSDAHTSAVA